MFSYVGIFGELFRDLGFRSSGFFLGGCFGVLGFRAFRVLGFWAIWCVWGLRALWVLGFWVGFRVLRFRAEGFSALRLKGDCALS